MAAASGSSSASSPPRSPPRPAHFLVAPVRAPSESRVSMPRVDTSDCGPLEGEELSATVARLGEALRSARRAQAQLTMEVSRLRSQQERIASESEAEEECITNKLLRRVDSLRQEKERLALEIDREEEFLTNNLQRKLRKVQEEKVELEAQLETEQEYLVNKLQKQMSGVLREKAELEQRLAAERDEMAERLAVATAEREAMAQRLAREETLVSLTLQAKLDELQREKGELERKLEAEQEYVVNRLQKQLQQVGAEKETLELRLKEETAGLLDHLHAACERLRVGASDAELAVLSRLEAEVATTTHDPRRSALETEVERLRNENFLLTLRLDEERERGETMAGEASRLAASLEADSERFLNTRTRSRTASIDSLSATGTPVPLDGLSTTLGRASSSAHSLPTATLPPLTAHTRSLSSGAFVATEIPSDSLGYSSPHDPFPSSSPNPRPAAASASPSASLASPTLGVAAGTLTPGRRPMSGSFAPSMSGGVPVPSQKGASAAVKGPESTSSAGASARRNSRTASTPGAAGLLARESEAAAAAMMAAAFAAAASGGLDADRHSHFTRTLGRDDDALVDDSDGSLGPGFSGYGAASVEDQDEFGRPRGSSRATSDAGTVSPMSEDHASTTGSGPLPSSLGSPSPAAHPVLTSSSLLASAPGASSSSSSSSPSSSPPAAPGVTVASPGHPHHTHHSLHHQSQSGRPGHHHHHHHHHHPHHHPHSRAGGGSGSGTERDGSRGRSPSETSSVESFHHERRGSRGQLGSLLQAAMLPGPSPPASALLFADFSQLGSRSRSGSTSASAGSTASPTTPRSTGTGASRAGPSSIVRTASSDSVPEAALKPTTPSAERDR